MSLTGITGPRTPFGWEPLEETFHTWKVVVLPATGPRITVNQWQTISFTITHEGVRTSVEINAQEAAIHRIQELTTDLLFYRDGVLMYRLRVVDSEDVMTREAATVKFDCVSYEKLLERRILHQDWVLKDQDIDAAWRLIEYTQKNQTLGITRGTTTPGIYRERAFDAGDDILTAINDLAQSDGGFDWWIDQDLKFWAAHPRRGKRLNLTWQYGAEVGELTRTSPIEDYASLVMATGAQQETRIPHDPGPTPPLAFPKFVDATATAYTLNTTEISVDVPDGIVEDDQIILGLVTIFDDEAPDVTSLPDDFVGISGFPTNVVIGKYPNAVNAEMRVWHKRAGDQKDAKEKEPAKYTVRGPKAHRQLFCLAYTGVHLTSPIDVPVSVNTGTGATSKVDAVVTDSKKCLILVIEHHWPGSTGPVGPTGMRERIDHNPLVWAGDVEYEGPGSTGSKTMDNNNVFGTSSGWAMALIALAPTKPVPKEVDDDVYPPPAPQIAQLPSKPYGLWEYTSSDTDVITTGALKEKAKWHLNDKGHIRPTYKMTLEPGRWHPGIGIGDIFTLRYTTPRFDAKVPVRIEELQIGITADGAESAALAVRAERPETPVSEPSPGAQMLSDMPGRSAPRIVGFADGDDEDETDLPPPATGRTVQKHRIDPTDDLGVVLRDLRRRLERAERSPGTGVRGGGNLLSGEGPPQCLTGSPGDYYVDTLDYRLFGPKAGGDVALPPAVTWDFKEVVSTPNDRLLDAEVGWVGSVYEDVDIVGFRFDGLTCGLIDTFDRPLGPLGSDWVSEPHIPAWNTANHDLAIVLNDRDIYGYTTTTNNCAVGTVADTAAPVSIGNTARWAHPQPAGATQSIEVFVDLYQFWNSAGGYIYLFTNGNGVNGACVLAEITHANWDMPSQPQDPLVRVTAFEADGTAHSDTETIPLYFGASDIRIRLESDPDGTNRLYYDTTQYTPTGEIVLLKTWQSQVPVSGPYVGFGTSFGDANGFPNSPKFNAVTVGCPGAGVIGTPDVPPTPVSGDLTVSIWNWDSNELLYRTTAPAAGTGWVTVDPPVRFTVRGGIGNIQNAQRWCVSIGGAAVPVRNPGNQFIYDSFPPLISSYGSYIGPVGRSPTTQQGYFGVFPLLYVRFQGQTCLAVQPEDVDAFEWGTVTIQPDTLVSGEIGKTVSVNDRGWLHGWRYKRMAGQTSPVTWTVWKWEWRYFDPRYGNIKQFPTGILAQVVDTNTGEGEFEVRLPEPLLMDPFGRFGPAEVVISCGGQIGIDYSTTQAETTQYSSAGWYNYYFGYTSINTTVGQFPQDTLGSSPNYPAWPMMPIMQRGDVPAWPTTDLKRSGPVNDPEEERVELHRNFSYATFSRDANGLRFYEGGPSRDPTSWGKGEGVPYWSSSLRNDGYSGIEFATDDWYDEEYGVIWPEPNRYTNKWAYYTWYYDYKYYEQWDDLDENNPYWPNGSWGLWSESGAWEDDAYYSVVAEGVDHAAGFHAESSGVGPMKAGGGEGFNETTGVATMFSSGFDGIAGTQLSVTPRVIQACFQPEGTYNTWWYGDGSTPYGLTPRGCVEPLITAASATATAADEPWQKQFFRQIGINTVTFNAGVGTIPVPTGMGLPAVVNAQVDGATAGGLRVAQARRTSNNAITVALDSAYDGTVDIGWSVDAAAITFGTPPPSIDAIRNPGTMALYGPRVEYDAGGGEWPFELVSWGNTFVNGCVLKDFTGATVGGPFTVEIMDTGGGQHYQRILWSAGRNWYLPGETQQYRMSNPDGQTSSWNVITWYEADVFAASTSDSALRTTVALPLPGSAPQIDSRIADEPREGLPASPTRYANNPRLRPEPPLPVPEPAPSAYGDGPYGSGPYGGGAPPNVQPLGRGADTPRERRIRRTPAERKAQRQARRDQQRQESRAKRGLPPETTDT